MDDRQVDGLARWLARKSDRRSTLRDIGVKIAVGLGFAVPLGSAIGALVAAFAAGDLG